MQRVFNNHKNSLLSTGKTSETILKIEWLAGMGSRQDY
jgi:hypothetical protein